MYVNHKSEWTFLVNCCYCWLTGRRSLWSQWRPAVSDLFYREMSVRVQAASLEVSAIWYQFYVTSLILHFLNFSNFCLSTNILDILMLCPCCFCSGSGCCCWPETCVRTVAVRVTIMTSALTTVTRTTDLVWTSPLNSKDRDRRAANWRPSSAIRGSRMVSANRRCSFHAIYDLCQWRRSK